MKCLQSHTKGKLTARLLEGYNAGICNYASLTIQVLLDQTVASLKNTFRT